MAEAVAPPTGSLFVPHFLTMKENHQNFGFIGFGCEPSDQNRSMFCEVLSEQTGLLEPFIRFNSLIMLMLLSENKH